MAGCAVVGCKSSTRNRSISDGGEPITFHRFPKQKDIRRRIWIHKCKRLINKFSPDSSRVCSLHFKPDDYERDLKNELLGLPTRKILKKTAIPSLNLPGQRKISNDAVRQRTEREKRKEQRERSDIIKKLLENDEIPEIEPIEQPETPKITEIIRIELEQPKVPKIKRVELEPSETAKIPEMIRIEFEQQPEVPKIKRAGLEPPNSQKFQRIGLEQQKIQKNNRVYDLVKINEHKDLLKKYEKLKKDYEQLKNNNIQIQYKNKLLSNQVHYYKTKYNDLQNSQKDENTNEF